MTKIPTNGYFMAAFGLPRVVHSYLPGTGSSAAGNLSTAAPYGIPPEEFTAVTEDVFSTATFNITGYSMSTFGNAKLWMHYLRTIFPPHFRMKPNVQ